MTATKRNTATPAQAFPEAGATAHLAPIAPGTPCFLTGSGRRLPDVIGRVVEVVRGPRAEFGEGPGPFYEIAAPWIAERFPGYLVIIVHRRHLLPVKPYAQGVELEATRDASAEAA